MDESQYFSFFKKVLHFTKDVMSIQWMIVFLKVLRC